MLEEVVVLSLMPSEPMTSGVCTDFKGREEDYMLKKKTFAQLYCMHPPTYICQPVSNNTYYFKVTSSALRYTKGSKSTNSALKNI